MSDFYEANRQVWDERAALHFRSEFYDVDGFRKGNLSLRPLEIEELGDVRGKSLLHLQCHFGLDTLSWARLGAQVTGADFSEQAVALARGLAAEIGLPARFLCCNIYDLPQHLDERFDVVFTSYGVLAWLHDLPAWGRLIARYLKPGGVFYMAEIHPFLSTLDDEVEHPELRVAYPYFHDPRPMAFEMTDSYAASGANLRHKTHYEWFHSLGEVTSALLDAGLRLEFLHEFPFAVYRALPFLTKRADGWWVLPDDLPPFPMTFSIRARLQVNRGR